MGEVVVGEEGEEAEEEAGLLFDVGLDGTALRPFVSGSGHLGQLEGVA